MSFRLSFLLWGDSKDILKSSPASFTVAMDPLLKGVSLSMGLTLLTWKRGMVALSELRLTDILWLSPSPTSSTDKDVKSPVSCRVLSGSVYHSRSKVQGLPVSPGSVTISYMGRRDEK